MYYLIDSKNRVLLKIQTSDSEHSWESDDAFIDKFIKVMKKIYNR